MLYGVAEVGLVQAHQTKGAAHLHLLACIHSCILWVPRFTHPPSPVVLMIGATYKPMQN